VHTHDDQMVLASPEMLPKISQGVTTVVVGNCGISLAPLVHANVPPPLNLLGGAGKHVFPTMESYCAGGRRAQPAVTSRRWSATRRCGSRPWPTPIARPRPPSRRRMVELAREAMAAGRGGPQHRRVLRHRAAADIDEVVLLARVAAEAGGVYSTHIRDERSR